VELERYVIRLITLANHAYQIVMVFAAVMMDVVERVHSTVRLDISVTRSPASVTPAGALPTLIAFRAGAVKTVFA